MKIEICEQMVQSWLQNCENCEIVQTNWSVSPLRVITQAEIDEVGKLMTEFQDQLNQELEDETKAALQELVDEDTLEEVKKRSKLKKLNIFKKSKASQFIRQCEIDVVGCKLDDGITEKIYLFDTAFHKNGLGYHDAVATVVKKIIRAFVVALIIFGENVPIKVGFASPKCGDDLKKKIENVVDGLRKILASKPVYNNIEIELYFNDKFATDIYYKLVSNVKELNNDNDLFMRAMNLMKLAEETVPPVTTPASSTPSTSTTVTTKSTTSKKTATGGNVKVVFDILKDLDKNGKLTPSLINDLKTPSFAKTNFSMSTFPVLKLVSDFPFSGHERCRYYQKTIKINGDEYLVCSQWIPERIAKLIAWHKAL